MVSATHNALMEHLRTQQPKHVNFAHPIVQLAEIQLFVSLVSLIFIFIWVNAQPHVLSLLLLQYQTKSKSANNAHHNVHNALH